MKKIREYLTLIFWVVVYLLCSYRYLEGRLFNSLVASLVHILSVAPFVIGLTIIIVVFLRNTSGERLPLDRTIRVYLTIGIITEFFYGLHDYLSSVKGPP